MAQHDYDIANQSGANFRADLNNALDAIVSNNSGSSEPSTTFAYEWWIDTSNNLLKLRNSANNAWITLPLSITADNETSGALTVNGNLTTTGTIDVNGQEIILDADADTSITADTDDQIDFRVGATDVMTLTNSHLVLKGTTPKITIGDGGEEDTALIFDGNAQDFYIGLDDSADDLIIGKGSTVGTTPAITIDENLLATFAGAVTVQGAFTSIGIDDNADTNVITIDTSERVGLGTATSPLAPLHVKKDSSETNVIVQSNVGGSGSAIGGRLRLQLGAQTNTGSGAADTQAGDTLGQIMFEGQGTDYAFQGGNIICKVQTGDGDDGRSNQGTFMSFETLDVGSVSPAEAMRIEQNGRFLIAKTSASRTTAGHEFHTDGFARHSVSGDKSLECVRTSNDGEVLEIFKDNTLKQFLGTASNSLFSDEKVKKDIKTLQLGLNLIKKLNPTEYRHILDDEDSPKSFGLIAQEFEKSLEEAGVEKNSTYLLQHKPSEDEAQSDYWLDYQKLTPILIKAIQELEERIKKLEG